MPKKADVKVVVLVHNVGIRGICPEPGAQVYVDAADVDMLCANDQVCTLAHYKAAKPVYDKIIAESLELKKAHEQFVKNCEQDKLKLRKPPKPVRKGASKAATKKAEAKIKAAEEAELNEPDEPDDEPEPEAETQAEPDGGQT